MKPIIGENICIKVSIGCSSFVIELPTLLSAEQPVDFNLLKFQISLARVLSIVPQQVKAKVLDALCWISSQFWFGIAYCGIIDKTVMD